jgi:hypothetical protein
MKSDEGIPIYELLGQGYDLGLQYGKLAKESIHGFLKDGLARLNYVLHDKVTLLSLARTLDEYYLEIEKQLPEIAAEIVGLSKGAAISLHEALLLQLRREITGYSKITSGDCTTFGRLYDGIVAQTIDLNCNMHDQLNIIKIKNTGDDNRRIILLSFSGLLGYLGMNSQGLAIGINLVLGGDWVPGIPGYMAIRTLLNKATSIEDCIFILDEMKISSSRSFTLCDGDKIATVEILNNKKIWKLDDVSVHTNHYLCNEFKKLDEINIFAKNGSKKRLEYCRSCIDNIDKNYNDNAYLEILSKPPLSIESISDMHQESTVARVIMNISKNKMFVKKGTSYNAKTHIISM